MFDKFIQTGACLPVAGLMYGYLKHLGFEIDLAQGSIKVDEFKIPHTWIEVNGEPIETTFTHGEPHDLAAQKLGSTFHIKMDCIYLKDQASKGLH